MASDRHRDFGLALRLGLVLLTVPLPWLAFVRGGGVATRIVALLLFAAAVAQLWGHLQRSNVAVARFIESIRFDDFSQRFSLGRGTGFEALGRALDEAIIELGARRSAAGEEVRFLSAVVDDAPAALLTIDQEGRVTLLNKAARRQFVDLQGIRLADFALYGPEFVAALSLPPAGRRLTQLVRNNVAQRVMVEAARIDRLGSNIRIVSVLPVQNVLGAAEMAAQSGLVRVLTHEIMNSLTPVTSLIRSAATILAGVEEDPSSLDEARQAVEVAARRAEGMHRFVESYRSFSRLPDLRRQRFSAELWVAEVLKVAKADPVIGEIAVDVETPPQLTIEADPDLLAQVCLNLLRNAAAAARGESPDPQIGISLQSSAAGATRIEVYDNGPGIAPGRRDDVFLPFYTTRPNGNGVGLSFARQVVVAHGGSIQAAESRLGGASIIVLI